MSAIQPEQQSQTDAVEEPPPGDADEGDEDVAGHIYTGALRDREQLPD